MTFAQSIRNALDDMMMCNRKILVCGQLVKFGTAGLTEGLYEDYPDQVITYPVSESLMNASAMGLALAGKRPVMVHERMDFLACGMDALVNHIPIWQRKCGVRLPLVILVIVGKGHGQGPQHSKNLTHWFRRFEGWRVAVPENPSQAYAKMQLALTIDEPTMYVAHRELFSNTQDIEHNLSQPESVRLCGAARRYEEEFYR